MEGSKRRVASASTTTTTRESFGSGAGAPTGGRGNASDAPGGQGAVPGVSGGNINAPSTVTPPLLGPAPIVTTTSLSVQLRDLLDTATLADIRKLEATGTGSASPQALERAATALRARADWLEAQARSMRTRAANPK